MDTKQAEVLTQKYLDGTASPEERAIFESWYNQSVHNSSDPMIEPDYKALQQRLAKSLPAGNKKIYKLWPRIAVAAAAVAAVTLGVWLYYSSAPRHLDDRRDLLTSANDIAPGKNGATITLANGKVIQLSDAKSGVVVGEEIKYDDGTALSGLQPSLPGGERNSMMLTASTAKGQTYQFTLPDGTKVWLNADSKISFPSKFSGSERKILLSGEAYFEVVKLTLSPRKGDLSQGERGTRVPFIVQTDKQEVEVLGTHFNINAYDDESNTKTTLLEGSVKVSTLSPHKGDLSQGGENRILKPSQQSVVSGYDRIAVANVDVSEAVDWKNGEFKFREETVESIMLKVARWYDVEVIYEKDAPRDIKLGGVVSRSRNVSAVLKMMELTNLVKFKIEGRKIVVGKRK